MSILSPAINRPMQGADGGLLALLSILWGGSFFFVGVAVRELPPFSIVTARVGLAALALVIALRLMGQALPREPRILAAFLGMGLLNNVLPFSLIVWGQGHIDSGLASILNATTPLFTVLVAHALTSDEKVTAGKLLGVALGFCGVTAMIGGAALRELGQGGLGVGLLAPLACLGAALSYAFAGLYGRRFRGLGVSPMATATGQLCASTLVLTPVMLVVDRPWTLPMPSAATLAALAGLALVSTAAAYVVYFRLLASAGATNLLLVTFLLPVSAVTLGVLVLGESLEGKHLAGMALIGLGLAAIDGRAWRALAGGVPGRKEL